MDIKIEQPKLKYLPFLILAVLFILVPYYYQQRQYTGIFHTDFYLFWFAGNACFLCNVYLNKISFNTITITTWPAYIYLLFLFLAKSSFDSNGIQALITLFSLINITCCFQIINKPKFSLVIVTIILLTYLLQVYIGYEQAIKSNFQSLMITGWLYNSGFFGNYLASIIPLLLSGFLTKKYLKIKFRVAFILFFTASVALLFLTIARAALIGTAIGCIIIVWPFFKNIFRKYWAVFLLIGFAAITILLNRLFLLKPDSVLGRLTIYKISINIIKDNFFFGVGPNRFSAVYNNYQALYFQQNNIPIQTQILATNTYEAFNSIIQILVEYGIVGFILFILIAYQILKAITNNKDEASTIWLNKGSKACIIAIFIASLFSNPFHVTPIFLILCYHFSNVLPSNLRLKLIKNRNPPKIVSAFILVTCISYYSITQYKAEVLWNNAHDLALYDNFNEAKIFYEKAYPHFKHNGDFLFNYGAEASLAKNYNLSIDLLNQSVKYAATSNIFLYLGDDYTSINQFELAENNYLNAIYMVPSHIYPKYQLVQLYKKSGKKAKEKALTNEILKMPIKIPSPFIDQLIENLRSN